LENIERIYIIAKNVKKLLKERDITQKKLADEIGISPNNITEWMSLRSAPSFGVIQDLADYFGVMKSDIDSTFKTTNNVEGITRDEQTLLRNYNRMNEAGKSALLERSDEMTQLRKYLKNNTEERVEFSQELA